MDTTLDKLGNFTTTGNKQVPQLKLTAPMLIDKSMVLYGPSGTGKTVAIKHILHVLQGHIDQAIVIAPTEPTNHSYTGWFDPAMVHYKMSMPHPENKKETEKKTALRFLEALYQRQELLASSYQRANSPEILAQLFRRLPADLHAKGIRYITDLNEKRERILRQLLRKHADDETQGELRKKEINDKFKKVLALVYKKFIIAARELLWGASGLSEEERISLTYIQANPRTLLIFDDCAAELKACFKEEIFRKLFYQGRHSYFTIILTCQDDTDFPANLRKSAFLSIFTTEVACSSNFNRQANQFPKPIRTYVTEIAPEIYQRSNRKLAYLREDPANQFFYHFEAPVHKPFLFGSSTLHELCEQVQTTDRPINKDNPYYQRFQP